MGGLIIQAGSVPQTVVKQAGASKGMGTWGCLGYAREFILRTPPLFRLSRALSRPPPSFSLCVDIPENVDDARLLSSAVGIDFVFSTGCSEESNRRSDVC